MKTMESITAIVKEKWVYQAIFLVLSVLFVALGKTVYKEISTKKQFFSSIFLWLTSWLMVFWICIWLELNFKLTGVITVLAAALWREIWDLIYAIGKNLPRIFQAILETKLKSMNLSDKVDKNENEK